MSFVRFFNHLHMDIKTFYNLQLVYYLHLPIIHETSY